MLAVLKNGTSEQQIDSLYSWIRSQGADVHIHMYNGDGQTIVRLSGDTSRLEEDMFHGFDFVESVRRITDPFKCSNRKFHPEDSVIDISGKTQVGGSRFTVIAGPCSVESEEQILTVARAVKKAGATLLRGGAFKPRTSPYDFQGLRADGIELLLRAKKEVGLPIVTEIMSASHLSLFEEVDVIQVGARNMQNFELLKELGHLKKPILLKRGLASTMKELLMSAEYIMQGGNENIILCERGVRTFETYTRNTLDLSAVPMLKELSHLPVIVDPSHATGIARLVKPMALAAAAAGADGLMIEVHNNPKEALCDGQQSLTPEQFEDVMSGVGKVLHAVRD